VSRVVAVGELLLRLGAPGAERLLQSPSLEATFGGAEFNVLASLARFGHEADFVTVLPEDGLGTAARATIRQHGVNDRYVRLAPGRQGLYFFEAGNGARPARVIYDRAASAFAAIDPRAYDWPAILAGADCLHLTGITPAVSASAAAVACDAARAAAGLGVNVSVDVNLRPQLWRQAGRDPATELAPLLSAARILFATPSDWAACLAGATPVAGGDAIETFAGAIFGRYPLVEILIVPSRRGLDASSFELGARLWRRGAAPLTAGETSIRGAAERIGSGDALVAGCLHGYLAGWPDARWLEFGLAAQALKHTIPGDINLVSMQEVEAVLAGHVAGRVLR
jgi:2-dehydro-3-deoxygluconokinase